MPAFDQNAGEKARRRIAIVHPGSDVPAEMTAVRQVLNAGEDDATLVHLCYEGLHFDSSRATAADPAFLFTRLDPPADLLLVLPQTLGLFPNTFTAAWLGTLLARGEVREIRIARDDDEHFRRLTDALRATFPATAFDEPDEHWLRLHPGADLAQCVAAVPSSYGFLHGIDREFRGVWPDQGSADAVHRGQLFNASRNSLILESVSERLGWGARPRLLDIGGSYGCLGLELAAKGWSVTVADNDPTKTELVGPWLMRLSPQPLAIEFWTLSMQDIATGGIPGDGAGWHAITFFLSLYHARNQVPALLCACWQRLVPGGALFIHEVVPEDERARVDDLQFEREELIRLVAENAAEPCYISMTDASLLAEFGHRGAGALLSLKPRSATL